MTTILQPRDQSLDVLSSEAAPFLGIAVAEACYQQQGGAAGFIRRYPDNELRRLARYIALVEFDTCWTRDCIALNAGGEMPTGPSRWVILVLPAIKAELERRARPKPTYTGKSPIARLKQLDLATVARRYTELQPAGPGKQKGRCPMHHERTPSFHINEETQRWRCYGACGTSRDAIDLLAAVRRRGVWLTLMTPCFRKPKEDFFRPIPMVGTPGAFL